MILTLEFARFLFNNEIWWTNLSSKQRPQPHENIELPFLAGLHSIGKIAAFYNDGLSMREVAKRMDIPKTTVRELLRKDRVAIGTNQENKSARALKQKFMRGGKTPYGYCYLENELVIDPREYKNVLEMVRLKVAGKSLRAICDALNGKGIFTRQGNRWKHEVVKNIIKRQLAAKASNMAVPPFSIEC